MPSTTWATCSQASTAASSDSKMSFQRITCIGSMPAANRAATPSRSSRSPSFSRRWISTSAVDRVAAGAQSAQGVRDLLGGAHEHLAQPDRLLHRSLDPVQHEPVAGLLREVDDVVQGPRQLVDIGAIQGRAPATRARVDPVDDVVGDAVALLLAQQQVAAQRGSLGKLREHVAQQQARPLGVARGLLEQLEELGVDAAAQ